jgi:5-methylcytosine-specific restriction endonuclease McrA
MENVIVLNSDYSFMGNIDWKRSIVLLYQGKAETIKETNKVIHNSDKTYSFIVPKVIRLISYVTQIFKNKIPYSKTNIFVRDNYICQYCNKKLTKNECTIDHVVPKSKGGISSWENCVTSCKLCNNYKGDMDLNKINLYLKKTPIQPSVSDFTRIKSKTLINNLKEIW